MKTFKPRFKEDRQWIFILLLPLGLPCFVLPVLIFVAIQSENIGSMLLAGGFLGIPIYLVGIIPTFLFVNSCFSNVTFTEDRVIIKSPKPLFPFFLVKKTIMNDDIIDVMDMRMKGDRHQFQFKYSNNGGRIRSIYLPQIKNEEYTRMVLAFKKKSTEMQDSSEIAERNEEILSVINSSEKTLYDKISKIIINILAVILIFGSGCIGTKIEGVTKIEGFEAGMCVALLSYLMCMIGKLPVAGQVLLYFYGKIVITFIMNLLNVPNIKWNINYFESINLDLLSLIFWPTFIFSIFISIGEIQTMIKKEKIKKIIMKKKN